MPFSFKGLELPGAVLVTSDRLPDGRGSFMEGYRESAFAKNGIKARFVQDNFSHSKRGVLRGLHFQRSPHAQAKLVRVVQGEIFDAIVDIRRGSPTFGRWIGMTLSSRDCQLLYVPEGFAHGFCVLSETADVFYKASSEFSPECDGGIMWNDPDIGISWPVRDPVVSERDSRLPALAELAGSGAC